MAQNNKQDSSGNTTPPELPTSDAPASSYVQKLGVDTDIENLPQKEPANEETGDNREYKPWTTTSDVEFEIRCFLSDGSDFLLTCGNWHVQHKPNQKITITGFLSGFEVTLYGKHLGMLMDDLQRHRVRHIYQWRSDKDKPVANSEPIITEILIERQKHPNHSL